MPSAIEWTGETLNFIGGCTKKSEGCRNCYALRGSWRISHNPNAPARYQGVCEKVDGELRWTGRINLDREALEKPLRWREPRMIFICSMSDLFHEDVPFEFIDRAFEMMEAARQHTFQVLTKRPDRALEWANRKPYSGAAYLDNGRIWFGTSVENQRMADERIHFLLQIPHAPKFVSIEPTLGRVDLRHIQTDVVEIDALTGDHGVYRPLDGRSDAKLEWVIAGGESGPNARPTHPDLFRLLRDQCIDAGVPFFFKQWGKWSPCPPLPPGLGLTNTPDIYWSTKYDSAMVKGPGGALVKMFRCGKKLTGRLLDGREWNQMPEMPEMARI